MAASVGRKNVPALKIRIGMWVFLCLNKKGNVICFPSKDPVILQIIKYYDNNSKILVDMVYAFNRLSGLLIITFITLTG